MLSTSLYCRFVTCHVKERRNWIVSFFFISAGVC